MKERESERERENAHNFAHSYQIEIMPYTSSSEWANPLSNMTHAKYSWGNFRLKESCFNPIQILFLSTN